MVSAGIVAGGVAAGVPKVVTFSGLGAGGVDEPPEPAGFAERTAVEAGAGTGSGPAAPAGVENLLGTLTGISLAAAPVDDGAGALPARLVGGARLKADFALLSLAA